MARSRSSGGGRSRSSGFSSSVFSSSGKSSSAKSSVKNPPKKVDSAAPPPAVHPQGNGGSSIMSSIADGFGWGAGRAFGERVVGSIFGPRVVRHEAVASPAPAAASNANSFEIPEACSIQNKTFTDCIYTSVSDIGKCQFYMDMLQECRKGSDAGLNV